MIFTEVKKKILEVTKEVPTKPRKKIMDYTEMMSRYLAASLFRLQHLCLQPT
jgi:hypothetical protein